MRRERIGTIILKWLLTLAIVLLLIPAAEVKADEIGNCLTFTGTEEFTLTAPKNWNNKIEYYNADTGWTVWDGTTIQSHNKVLYLRGSENKVISNGYSWTITPQGTGTIACSGDIRTLLNYSDPAQSTMDKNCFCAMFQGCTGLTEAPELPATTLAESCYDSMFSGCTGLTEAPELPATTLAESCYSSMFDGCTGLTEAPALPAKNLAPYCYYCMFAGCSGLTAAPTLPATTLAESCYDRMFSGCTGLTVAPDLPATTLAPYCYLYMFLECTGLTAAPALPAKILAESCYSFMFEGCTGLTAAPAMQAETLAENCYGNMFIRCTGLTSAPALPAKNLAPNCYYYMFAGCSGLTAAPTLPATTLAGNCYQNMFSECTGLTEAPALPATTLANACYSSMFEGCTGLTVMPALPATTLANFCYASMFAGCKGIKISAEKTGEYKSEYRIPQSGQGKEEGGGPSLLDMFKDTGGTFTGTPDINRIYYVVHLHQFSYSSEGAAITATCANEHEQCYLDDGKGGHTATLTIIAPERTAYGGTESAEATLTGLDEFNNTGDGKTIKTSDIRYSGRDGTTYAESPDAPVNAGKYTAKITLTGVKTSAGGSGDVSASVDYEIAKIDPTAAAPSAAAATYGQTLADVTLTNPEGNTEGTWSWADAGSTSVGDVGSRTFKANFTPDSSNYKTVTCEVTLQVNPKSVTVTAKDQTIKEGESFAAGTEMATLTGALEGHALSAVTLTGDPEKGSITPSEAVIKDAAGNDVSANYDIGYTSGTLTVRKAITRKVTFKVVNGSWDDGKTEDISVTLNGFEGDVLKLAADQIPAVGSKPDEGYKEGSWDRVPGAEKEITADTVYTYTYLEKDKISQKVTFKVANGYWDDGSTEDKVVTLTGLEGDTLKLPAEKIPAVGSKPADTYKAGAWDTEPKADTVITEDVTYTYTYAKKTEIRATVTFRVVNGAWDDGTTEDKTVTLTGYEGDTLKLKTEDIPAVGGKPAEGYEAGAWDTVPAADKEITADTVYTYTYTEKAPEPEPEPEPIPKGRILLPVISKVQKTAMTVSWNKIKSAEGYEVFYGPCGEDSHNAKVIRVSAKKTGCRLKNLKKKGVKSYKVWVRAYVVREGKRIPISTSLKIDSFMKGASAVFTNPKSVSLGTKQIPLKVGKTAKITASVEKEESGKKLTSHLPELRYVSSNTSVASVAEDGTVKGVGNGKCKVYVIAPNGIYKAVQVTVGVKAEKLSFTEKQVKVKAGEELDLRALLKAEPKGAYLELKWESKDKKIAKVGKDGVVKGRKKGKTKITVEDKASGLKATILVIVTD